MHPNDNYREIYPDVPERFAANLDAIADAMISARKDEESFHYLDQKTGRPETFSENLLNTVLNKDQSILRPLSPAEQARMSLATEAMKEEAERFLPIPEIEVFTEYSWMEEFSHFVSNPFLEKKLERLFDVAEKIDAFEKLLAMHPEEQGLWLCYIKQRKSEEAALFVTQNADDQWDT